MHKRVLYFIRITATSIHTFHHFVIVGFKASALLQHIENIG